VVRTPGTWVPPRTSRAERLKLGGAAIKCSTVIVAVDPVKEIKLTSGRQVVIRSWFVDGYIYILDKKSYICPSCPIYISPIYEIYENMKNMKFGEIWTKTTINKTFHLMLKMISGTL
jgi:hypothetical protein